VTAALQGASCATHAGATAVDLCTRCGSFLCGECVEYLDTAPYCERCHRLVTTRASLRARVSAALSGLGVLGMLAGFVVQGRPGLGLWALAVPTGFVGLASSLQELAALTRGEAPTPGRPWATVGRALGALHTALVVGLVALFAWFLLSHREG
jgi:hypothetical protein